MSSTSARGVRREIRARRIQAVEINKWEVGGNAVTGVGWLGRGVRLWALRLSPCYVVLPAKNGNSEG